MLHIFTGDRQPSHRRILAEAHREKLRGRYGRAVVLYQYAQSVANDSAEIASRVAPLLALEGRHYESWRQYQRSGRALLKQNRTEWALSVFYEATRMLPKECDTWRVCASIERKLGRLDHALETLLEGRRQFRSALDCDQAIALLGMARHIEPWDTDIVLDLASLLSRIGQIDRALRLLEQLIDHCPDEDLHRIHAAQLRITWSPHHVGLWLETCLRQFMPGRSEKDEGMNSAWMP